MPAIPKAAYLTLTMKEKRLLCLKAAEKPSWSPAALGKWAGEHFDKPRAIPRTTVVGILCKRHLYGDHTGPLAQRKRLYTQRQRAFDSSVIDLMDKYKKWHTDATISGKTALRMARRCGGGSSNLSRGWLYRFQQRSGLWFAERHGEVGSVDSAMVEEGRVRLRRELCDYDARDIFNMDETSFFFEKAQRGTLTTDKVVKGKMSSKARLTMAAAANADGSECLPLLFVGKAHVPVPLRGHGVFQELGVHYTNNSKAWMTTEIYHDWLLVLNDEMTRLQRRIVALVDSVSTDNSDGIDLSHVLVMKLLPNTTTVLQPCDQGIIKGLKDHFHDTKNAAELDNFFNGSDYAPINIYTAMKYCAEGWTKVSAATIRNCLAHTGLITKMDMAMLLS